MYSNAFKCLVVGLLLGFQAQAQSGASLFDPTVLHEIRLYFPQDNFWDILEENYDTYIDDSGVEVPYLGAIISIDGYVLDTVGVREKGLSSNYASSKYKKPFKIDLNVFTPGQSYDGVKKFNLHNGAADPSMMRDFVAYNVNRTAGTPAPRVSHCKLYINDQFWGVYGIIEQIDKTFLERNFADASGTLIKNIGWSELDWQGPNPFVYKKDFQLKTNEEADDWSDFIEFLDVLNNAPDDVFAEEIQKVFNVDGYLHVLAVDILTDNWDSYIDNQRNWYLYHDPSTGLFNWIPWDYNLSLGGTFSRAGNPYPPFDSTCFIKARFDYIHNADDVLFFDTSEPEATSWFWDFGDGQVSYEQNPIHHFTGTGKVNVCLTASRPNDGKICQHTRCREIDLDFNPADCLTATSGAAPYSPTDPIFQQVVMQDDYCCSGGWDALCEVQYVELQNAVGQPEVLGVPYDLDFPLVLDNPDKILIDRLLSVPEFLDRYLEIVCVMLETNFNAERLFPLIDQQVNLIRPAIYEDPNYNFTLNYFEYDAGDGSGGGGGAKIPALKWVLNKRFSEIRADLNELGYDCSNALTNLAFRDVVINELMASNDEDSGIADPAGEYDDWIELYNNTSQTIDLASFYLSDDPAEPKKWKFPEGAVLDPSAYLIVWADKDEMQAGLHANFKLSKSGETLWFSHEDGTLIDSLTFGQQITNISSARIPNGSGPIVRQAPTFAADNELVNAVKDPVADDAFRVYPNPASDYVQIRFSPEVKQPKYIRLLNAVGQVMRVEGAVLSDAHTLRVDGLAPGFYWLVAESGKDAWRKKIIIE